MENRGVTYSAQKNEEMLKIFKILKKLGCL